MKKSLLLSVLFLVLLQVSFSQESVTSLNKVKGTYSLTNNQDSKFSFNKIIIEKNSFSLFLDDHFKEKFKLISDENDFLEFEKVYETAINSPEIKRIRVKIYKISATELKVLYKDKETTFELFFSKLK